MEDHVKGLLPHYHDGELAAVDARAVEQHLAACTTCRAELLALRTLSSALADLADLPSAAEADAFWRRLQPRLAGQRAAPPWRSWLPGLLLLGLHGLLGLVSAVLMFGPLIERLTGIDAGLPALPGIYPIGLFSWAGVLYLVWLAVWWSRYHAASDPSYA